MAILRKIAYKKSSKQITRFMKGNRVIFPDSLKTPRCPKPTGMNLMSTKSYVKVLCLNGDPPSEADSYHGEFEEEEDNLLLSFYSSIK